MLLNALATLALGSCPIALDTTNPDCVGMSALSVAFFSTNACANTCSERFCSGADSYIQVFGKFDFADPAKRLTAGDWNVRMYELQNDTSVYSAGGDLFANEVLEMGDGSFVLKVPVTLPSASSSGLFTVSLITRDQDHLDDMCIEIGLNYTS